MGKRATTAMALLLCAVAALTMQGCGLDQQQAVDAAGNQSAVAGANLGTSALGAAAPSLATAVGGATGTGTGTGTTASGAILDVARNAALGLLAQNRATGAGVDPARAPLDVFGGQTTGTPASGVTAAAASGPSEVGEASHYGVGDNLAGRPMANGQPMRPYDMIAAHRTLPLGSYARVDRLDGSGQSVVVQICDRGPAAWTGRVIDLSYGAAQRLGFTAQGTAQVRVTPLGNTAAAD